MPDSILCLMSTFCIHTIVLETELNYGASVYKPFLIKPRCLAFRITMQTSRPVAAILFLILVSFTALGQGNTSIRGKIVDAKTNSPIPGVNVFIKDMKAGAVTDSIGNFSFSVKTGGTVTLQASMIGYNDYLITLNLDTHAITHNISLIENARTLDEVIVQSDRITERNSVSDVSLSPGKIAPKQGLWEDPLRAVSILPGVHKQGGDLFSPSQIFVRGGAPDENLFLMDNTQIYWPWYQGGIRSIFNMETIQLGRFYQYGNEYPNNIEETVYNSTPFLNAGGFKISF